MTFRTPSLIALAICVLSGAQMASADDSPALSSGKEFFQWYEESLKPLASGVYEKDGEIYFHYHAPMSGSGMFRENKAAGKAMHTVSQMIFAWISSNMVDRTAITSSSPFGEIPDHWFDRNAEASRVVQDLPSRILYRGTDGDFYVLTLGVPRAALVAEAAKGPFEKRPEVRKRQWKTVVQKSLTAPDRMAFFRDCGAFDLWTILSEETSGTKTISWSPETQEEDCLSAIKSLYLAATNAPGPAASEWKALLESFLVGATSETNVAPALASTDRIRIMLLSFASCLPSKGSTALDLDRMLALMDEPATNTAATDGLIKIVAKTPDAELPWCALGDRFLAVNAPFLAIASFRNALRVNHAGALALDGLRRSYTELGKPVLARGVALLIIALAEDGTLRASAEQTLQGAGK